MRDAWLRDDFHATPAQANSDVMQKCKEWKRSGTTMARDQVEMCRVTKGWEKEKGEKVGTSEVEWLKGLRS